MTDPKHLERARALLAKLAALRISFITGERDVIGEEELAAVLAAFAAVEAEAFERAASLLEESRRVRTQDGSTWCLICEVSGMHSDTCAVSRIRKLGAGT